MRNILLIFLILLAVSCHQKKEVAKDGAFMNMEYVQSPQLLMPNLIASPFDEYNGTFSPDGKVFFYTTNTPGKGIITYTKMTNDGTWTQPKVAPFSGQYSEYDPLFSPDGEILYFTSERPVSESEEAGKTNIWYVIAEDAGWSEPLKLELGVSGVYYSSVTHERDIYFNIWDTGDMYKAIGKSGKYQVERLDSLLNSTNGEGDPFVSPEEDYLIFRGYNNSFGQGDLYISFQLEDKWTEPENLGEPINSSAHEMCPYVTVDGKYFIFASNRMQEYYTASPMCHISELSDKFKSYDNGNLNIYYVSTDFISLMRNKYNYKEKR